MKIRKKASKGLAATIGLISEGMSARKPDPPDEDEDEQHDEDWYLDEIQDLLSRDEPDDPETKPESKIRSKDVDILAEAFLRNHHPPPAPRSGDSSSKDCTARTRLAYPVILPQRSFYSRKCGFIRAYAPVLADCGIDKTTFLHFLDMMERAAHVKPWLFAINIASFGTAMLPNGIPMATPIAVQLNVKEAMKAEERRRCVERTNTYIDIVNDEFFRPRGLYCLVLTWRPETFSPYTIFDQPVGPDLPMHMDDEASILENFRSKYQRPDGTTHERRVPFLETASLVFPQLDDLQDRGDPWPTLSGRIREEEFFANYLEKRAQAQSTTDNPDSAKGPQPTFCSRYADSAHPSNEGSLMSAVSGGKVDPDQVLPALSARRSRRYQKPRRSGPLERLVSRLQRGSSRSGTSSGPHNEGHRSSPGPRQLGAQFGFVSGIKKFTSNTIYLMIVNMPTEEEMAQAEEMIR